MASVPEFINHYLSKFLGLRLLTKTDFDHIYVALLTLNKHSYFHYMPNTPEMKSRLKEIYKLIKPVGVEGIEKVRIGNPGDGGYIFLNSFNDIESAISLGISTDVSWDSDIASRNINIYQYDHTVSGPPVQNDRFHFHKLKISAKDEPGAISLDNIVHKYSLTKPGSVLLKMDIEGDEWETLLSVSDKTLETFSQIACEFHDLNLLENSVFFERAVKVLGKIKDKFEVIHIHGNNCSPLLICPNSRTIPQVLEITLANKNFFRFVESTESYPGPLDAPCDPSHEDYHIDVECL